MKTMARKPASRSASPGFTLMELLVSFTLIGLVAIFIHLGYSVGLGAREKAEASLEDFQNAQASLDVLSRQVASMVSYVTRQEHEERTVPVLLFRASRRSLGFVTTWSAASGFAGGLRFVQVFVAEADPNADPDSATSGRRLLLNERPLPPEERLRGAVIREVVETEDNRYLPELAPPRAGPRSFTLAEGLESATFRIRARPRGEGFPLGSRINPRRFQAGFRQIFRQQIPAGVRLSLRWNGQGPWGSKTFELAVPVGGH